MRREVYEHAMGMPLADREEWEVAKFINHKNDPIQLQDPNVSRAILLSAEIFSAESVNAEILLRREVLGESFAQIVSQLKNLRHIEMTEETCRQRLHRVKEQFREKF